jgi:hypothetical protein
LIYGGQFWFGQGEYFAPNPPAGAVLTYSLAKADPEVQITISDSTGKIIRTMRGPANPGMNRVCWDLRIAPPFPAEGPASMAGCAAPGYGEGRPPLSGPIVLPGKYAAILTPMGGSPMKTEIVVQPDPAFAISDADRSRRNTAIMSAYKLQQQLVPVRDALVALNKQLTAMRQYLIAAGDSGKEALAPVQAAETALTGAQGALNRTLNAGRTAQTAMDGYDGLPTEAQLRQLDWTWEDAAANVSAVNRILSELMPPVYTAMGGAIRWPKIAPVAAVSR